MPLTLRHVVSRLGLSLAQLRSLGRDKNRYRVHRVPKRNGGTRVIRQPSPRLADAQRRILGLFRFPIHTAVHGYVVGRSTGTNARVHAGAAVVLSLDIRNFFDALTYSRVHTLFHRLGCDLSVASLFARICTERSSLPQGAVSSPVLANAVMLDVDRKLGRLAGRFGFRYTRYVDDLTFSSKVAVTENKLRVLQRRLVQILRREGFLLAQGKVKARYPWERQTVTRIVVNDCGDAQRPIRVPREFVRRIRAALNHKQRGIADRDTDTTIAGWISYVEMVDKVKGQKLKQEYQALSN